ncbi:methyl-accepting chemotaxis protein [Acidocella aromatica]|uniref:Methyl-accepting chemotaxis protein n=1 Tax=Acidocella aromatica TaxID=1303579 RepID=A0A840VC18_9PROT|nr:methyl-accepting chemotaxis protein [Acidocella aromatica]MBB5372387.1 methyl-accepting chemotaxis protein [Acidocella aromatica]
MPLELVLTQEEAVHQPTITVPETSGRAASTMQRVKTMVTGLERRFQEIASIADVINHVAKHTKLLSFNATIEAARAGEAGRGFSVVASEVRTLAERTASATADINEMLPQVKQEIAEAVRGVEQEEAEALLQSAIRLAGLEAARVEAWFRQIAATLHALKHALVGLRKSEGALSRPAFNAVMTEFLTNNPGLLALACCMEPNAFDGRDAEFVNTEGTDASGRFVSYWYRGNGRIAVEPLQGYDTPGRNDYYELPRRTGADVMMEPYDYPVAGNMVKMTSLMSPLKLKGRFAGVLGADFLLDELQAELSRNKPFGTGNLLLLSHGGMYATHPDALRIGQTASDLSSAARQAVSVGRRYDYVDEAGIARIFHPLQIGAANQPWALMLVFDIAHTLNHGAK